LHVFTVFIEQDIVEFPSTLLLAATENFTQKPPKMFLNVNMRNKKKIK